MHMLLRRMRFIVFWGSAQTPLCFLCVAEDKITHTTFLKTGLKGGWNRICLHIGPERIFGKSYVFISCPRTFRSPKPKPAFSRFANKSLLYGRVAGLLATVTTILKPFFGGTRGCAFVKLSAFQQPSVKIDCFSAVVGPETAGCKSKEENAVGSRVTAVSSKKRHVGSKNFSSHFGTILLERCKIAPKEF